MLIPNFEFSNMNIVLFTIRLNGIIYPIEMVCINSQAIVHL